MGSRHRLEPQPGEVSEPRREQAEERRSLRALNERVVDLAGFLDEYEATRAIPGCNAAGKFLMQLYGRSRDVESWEKKKSGVATDRAGEKKQN